MTRRAPVFGLAMALAVAACSGGAGTTTTTSVAPPSTASPITETAPPSTAGPATTTTVPAPAADVVVESRRLQQSQVVLPPGANGVALFENRDAVDYPVLARAAATPDLVLPANGALRVDLSGATPDRHQVAVLIGEARSIVVIDTRVSFEDPQALCDRAADVEAAHEAVVSLLDDAAAVLAEAGEPAEFLAAYDELRERDGPAAADAFAAYREAWDRLGAYFDGTDADDARTVADWAGLSSLALRSGWPRHGADLLTEDRGGAAAAAGRIAGAVAERCPVDIPPPPGLGGELAFVAVADGPDGLVQPIEPPSSAAFDATYDYVLADPAGVEQVVTIDVEATTIGRIGGLAKYDLALLLDGIQILEFDVVVDGLDSYTRFPGQPWTVADPALENIRTLFGILDPFTGLQEHSFRAAASVTPDRDGGRLVYGLTGRPEAADLLGDAETFALGTLTEWTLVVDEGTGRMAELVVASEVEDDQGVGAVLLPGTELVEFRGTFEIQAVNDPGLTVDVPEPGELGPVEGYEEITLPDIGVRVVVPVGSTFVETPAGLVGTVLRTPGGSTLAVLAQPAPASRLSEPAAAEVLALLGMDDPEVVSTRPTTLAGGAAFRTSWFGLVDGEQVDAGTVIRIDGATAYVVAIVSELRRGEPEALDAAEASFELVEG